MTLYHRVGYYDEGTSTPGPITGTPTATSPNNPNGANVPANAVDGNTATYWQTVNPAINVPALTTMTLVVTFPAAGTLSSVGITFYAVGFQFVDYTVETWNGTSWTVKSTKVGNAAAVVSHPITPTVTDRFRFVATAWTGAPAGAVKEVTWT